MRGDGWVLDGFRIGRLPQGVGGQVADFASEWDVRTCASTRLWERQVEDGYRVSRLIARKPSVGDDA